MSFLTNHLPLPTFDSVLFPQHALIGGLFPHLHIYHAQPEYLFAPHHPKIWDIATKHILSRFEGHTNRVICLNFSRDGRLIISGSWDNTVRIWDTETKQHETLSITAQVDVRVIVTYHGCGMLMHVVFIGGAGGCVYFILCSLGHAYT
jgi:WD domain, G-beta repeat